MKNRKKICLISYSNFPVFSPRKLRLVFAVREAGYDIHVLCLKSPGKKLMEKYKDIVVYRVPLIVKRGNRMRYLLQYMLSFTFFFSWIIYLYIKYKYSLIVVQGLPDSTVLVATLPKIFGSKILFDCYDLMPELYATKFPSKKNKLFQRFVYFAERVSQQFADFIITANIYYKKVLINRGTPERKIAVIHNSPDEKIFGGLRFPSFNPRQERDFTLLFHGGLTERNALEVGIKALYYIKQEIPHARLLVVGDGECKERLIELCQNLNLYDCVEFTGIVPVQDIPFFIKKCDLGIITNKFTPHTEINLPNRILEYSWMGKPFVVSQTTAISNYFSALEPFFATPGDPLDFAQKIIYLYKHPDLANSCILEGQKVLQKICWSVEKQKFLRIIDLLSGREK